MLRDLNMIQSFKLTDEEYASWTENLFRLYPSVTPEIVGKIVDEFLMGNNIFVKEDGFLNISVMVKRYLGIF